MYECFSHYRVLWKCPQENLLNADIEFLLPKNETQKTAVLKRTQWFWCMWSLVRTLRNTPHCMHVNGSQSIWGMIMLHKPKPTCIVMDRTVRWERTFIFEISHVTWEYDSPSSYFIIAYGSWQETFIWVCMWLTHHSWHAHPSDWPLMPGIWQCLTHKAVLGTCPSPAVFCF